MADEEILALEAIYPDLNILRQAEVINGRLEVDVITERLEVKAGEETFSVSSLPPIILNFHLMHDYPAKAPVTNLECAWLSQRQLKKLNRKVQKQFVKHEVVLYQMIDFLQHNTLDGISDVLRLDIKGLAQDQHREVAAVSRNVKSQLLKHDKISAREYLDKEEVDCLICIERRKGRLCHQFDCQHAFCYDCLNGYFGMCVGEGRILDVHCPHPSCKMAAQLNVDELGEALKHHGNAEALVKRYAKLSEKLALEIRDDIVWCPRPSCEKPVTFKPSENQRDMCCICQDCGYAFCAICKRSWHGNQVNCVEEKAITSAVNGQQITIPLVKLSSAIAQYKEANDHDKQVIEQQFGGKKAFLTLTAKFEQEKQSHSWIKTNTKSCPTCGTRIDKSSGCNHMTCAVCREHWCWLCGSWLDPHRLFQHYNDRDQSPYCFQSMFQETDIETMVEDTGQQDTELDQELFFHYDGGDYIELEELDGTITRIHLD